MRSVIYDPEDMEPLTVIDIPEDFVKEIEQGKRGPYLRFAITEQPQFSAIARDEEVFSMPKIAEVKFERLHYRGKLAWLVMAMNPEICLLLKSDLLPGQRRDAQQRERRARKDGFVEGLMAALKF